MLPQTYRLKKQGDFRRTYNKGLTVANPYLVLYSYKRTDSIECQKSRIGFSVSKKLGSAVERNRIKRVMRAVLRTHICKIKDSYDIILIARVKIKGISFPDVEKKMVSLFKRARLFKEDR